jgi:diguanylate cyclase (GGDEF)-like protein/PAS domain S-box-containing protein
MTDLEHGVSSSRLSWSGLTRWGRVGQAGWHPVLTGLGVYLGIQLALISNLMPEGIAFLWLPNALLLCALLTSRAQHWAAHLAAALLAELVADWSQFGVLRSLAFGLVNGGEALLGAALLTRGGRVDFRFERLADALRFGVAVPLVACASAALFGAALHLADAQAHEAYATYWQIWWFGDALGTLLLTPLLLAAPQPAGGADPPSLRRRLDAALWFAVGVLGCALVFLAPARWSTPMAPVLLFVPALWVATHLGLRSGAGLVLVAAAFAILSTSTQQGPFADPYLAHAVMKVQAFVATLSFTTLSLAALVQELRRRNDELRLRERAIEALDEGVVLVDATRPDLPVHYVNPKFEQITGYALDEMRGRNCRVLYGSDRDQPDLPALRLALARGEPARALLRNYRRDGRMFWNELTVAPVHDDAGRLCAYIGIQRDVSAARQADEALREARAELLRVNAELEQRIGRRTVELEQANLRLTELAHTDALTGCWNRRYFIDALGRALAASQRSNRPLSVLLMDIDHFKAINDRAGHAAGDETLRALVRQVTAALRPSDVFARFGGEEFVVLLPDTPLAEARGVAERLRADLERHGAADLASACTISVGVAECLPDEAADALLQRADAHMYQAKLAGRNQVCG